MTTLRFLLTIPASLQGTYNYTIQFSVCNTTDDNEAFLEQHIAATDLAAGNIATIRDDAMPRFKSGGRRELKAHYWKGGKLVGTQDLGVV